MDIDNQTINTINLSLNRFLSNDLCTLVKENLYHDKTSIRFAKFIANKRIDILNDINDARSRKNGYGGVVDNNSMSQCWLFQPKNKLFYLKAINCKTCGNYIEIQHWYIIFELPESCICNCPTV